jgi:23S rRNA pseudouridine1911/1915/1917 synthase
MQQADATLYVVPADLQGERADKIVAVLADLSRGRVKVLIDADQISIEGSPVKASDRLDAGVVIEVINEVVAEEVAATEIAFDVAYLDDEVIVVDKPPGLVVHPGPGHADDTLLNGLLFRFPELRDLGEELRFGLLHRLDRDTSGLLVVARVPEVYTDLRAKLADRDIVRKYLALVFGAAPAATGTIDAPIGRDPNAPTRNAVKVGGRPARTHYRRLAEWDDVSLLSVTLETGRTHQIRVHLHSIGLPVVGDRIYGRVDPRIDPGRTFLHAAELRFTTVGGAVHELSSQLPDDLQQVLDSLDDPESGAAPG